VIGDPIAGIDVPIANLAGALLRLAVFGVLFGAAAVAVGAALGRRGLTVAITATVGLGLFLLATLARIVPRIERLGEVSPFEWLLGGHPIATGLTAGVVTGVVLAAAIVVGGTVALEHRDVR
jgi:ABC-2 type transport system permease protein